jgi:2-polyprenyl-3-methyl-5-hydroxy-6-metoxy-1,4-benzoquinol methylase
MPWSWPVTVNLHESVAFANWAAKKTGRPLRVMTELEHNAIRDDEQRSRDSVVKYSSSMSMAEAEGVNSNLSYSSMNPVDAFRPNKRGAYDVFGNAWEWTLDYFSPLENFSVHRLYEDFSTPCFDGLHHVIQGSSFISTGNEASIYSRYHFRAHFLQHASFRLVDPLDSPLITSDTDAPGPYVGSYPFRQSREGLERRESERMNRLNDTDTLLARHFGSHPITGSPDVGYGDIAKTIIETFQGVSGSPFHQANVLEVGSGAGGLTVHLAANGRRVLSTDHEERHIETVRVAAAQRSMSIDFRRTDPLCLPAELQGFDVVVLNDVIDRLAAPGALLGRLAGPRGLLRPGGLLAVLSAFQWDAERTPRELWIAGDRPADSLAARLGPDFRLVGESKQQLLWWESSSDIGGKQLALLLFVRETN